MKSTEKMEERLNLVDMHNFFLKKIDDAICEERYIEASWLIYSCIENRFFRTLQKYKKQCKYCSGKCKKNKNELAISTKIACVKRLLENNVNCISESFTPELLENTRLWVKNRNNMMHDLLSLETYQDMDERFKISSIEGKELLDQLYNACTLFREKFYTDGYEFVFPEVAMEGCICKPRNNNEI
jgi:hypothetical protein